MSLYPESVLVGPLDELVVGSGIHAAIYVSNRDRPPAVVERNSRVGGAFAEADKPVFYLNSRNRPFTENGITGPGTEGPLNYIPGGILQPSDVNCMEYQTQSVLAAVVRDNLVAKAVVFIDSPLEAVFEEGNNLKVVIASKEYSVQRVLLATGLGNPLIPFRLGPTSARVWSFPEFVRIVGSVNNSFSPQDFGRVAVIGSGDGGKVVMEHLMGQGPSDPGVFLDKVDWYGQDARNCEEFTKRERSRYAGLGRNFPNGDRSFRIRPINARVLSVESAGGRALVRCLLAGEPTPGIYDTVIYCCGFGPPDIPLPPYEERLVREKGEPIATKLVGCEVYKMGPCAGLSVDYREKRNNPLLDKVPQNTAAIFRYAGKTAALARRLPSGAVGNVSDEGGPM